MNNLDMDANEDFEPAKAPEAVEAKQPEKIENKTVALVERKAIQAQESGVIVGVTFEDQYRLAKLYCHSRMLPQALDTPEKVFTAMQFVYELGLKGITALRNVCVINGTPSLWGDLPLALVKKSGRLVKIREWIEDKDGNEICPANKNLTTEVYGAFCQTVRSDQLGTTEHVTWFTVDDSRKAGLLGNPKKEIWAKYTRRMLQMRARAQNLKDNFGDCLMGAGIAEYDYNAVIENGTVVESDQGALAQSLTATLNQKFLSQDAEVKEEG